MSKSVKKYLNNFTLNGCILHLLSVIVLLMIVSCSPKQQKDRAVEKNIYSKLNLSDRLCQKTAPLIIMSQFDRSVLDQSKEKTKEKNQNFGAKYNGANNQLWRIEKINSEFVIYSLLGGLSLSINLNDSSVEQQAFEGKSNQLWNFSGKDDSLRIQNKATKMYLSLWPKKLITKPYDECESQLWKILQLEDYKKLMSTCNCKENLDFVKFTMETSYAGFQDKVNSTSKVRYDSLRNALTSNAQHVADVDTCYEIIKRYLIFFKDEHVQFYQLHRNSPKRQTVFKKVQGAERFQLYNVNEQTLLLSLPNFHIENKERIDGILNFHKEKILKTPFLILDLRSNGGGDDRSWDGIIPFLYTNPIYEIGNDIWASKEMTKRYELNFKYLKKFDGPKEVIREQSELIELMKKNQGKFVVRSHDGITKFDSVTKNPQKIIILINEYCGSSGEQFILAAKQSKKVILMGQNTSGCLDYSNVFETKCPSPAFQFLYATTRSRRLPGYSVDKEGIKPNIYLQHNQDWIKEAVAELEKK